MCGRGLFSGLSNRCSIQSDFLDLLLHPALRSEHEKHRAEDAETGPKEIELQWLSHIEPSERHEHQQSDHCLHDLELTERKRGRSDAVCGELQEILEQRHTPAQERGNVPWSISQSLQVAVPCVCHEKIREHQEQYRLQHDRHRT